MDLFSQNELLVMAVIVGMLLFVLVILALLDVRDYFNGKKKRVVEVQEMEEECVKTTLEEVSSTKIVPEDSMTYLLEEEILEFSEPVIVKKEENQEIEQTLSYQEITLTKEEAQMELKKIEAELTRMEELDPFEDTVTNFELEQEENAIISLDELTRLGDTLYDNNVVLQYDDGDEPITIDEVISKFSNPIDEEKIEESFQEPAKEEVNKVPIYEEEKPIPFISSLYGFEKSPSEMEFENTANFEKLEREISKNNEFLERLKEIHNSQES